MSEDLSRFATCNDVTDADMDASLAPAKTFDEISPRARSLALVDRMAAIATPRAGAARILVLAARIASHDWIEGDMVVRLIGDDEVTVLEILVDDGLSQERIAGPLRIDVPLAEFRNAINLKPILFRPLTADGAVQPRRIELRSNRSLDEDSPKSFSAAASGLMRAVSGSSTLDAARARVTVHDTSKAPLGKRASVDGAPVGADARRGEAPRKGPPPPSLPRPNRERPNLPPRNAPGAKDSLGAKLPAPATPAPRRKKSIASFERPIATIHFPDQPPDAKPGGKK